MKLKYYLRGLGMGIIFATLILMISGAIHNNNLSEEEIIQEAKKLGMVMEEETEKVTGALWMRDNTEKEEDSKNEEDSEVDGDSKTDVMGGSENTEGPDPSGEITYVMVPIYPGDSATAVAKRMQENGLVENADEFCKYIKDSGNTTSINVGEFQIPMGASYEQILEILIEIE